MKKIDFAIGIALGVTGHDVVSAYFPHGGHVPGFHAFYFFLPLALILILMKLHRRRHESRL